METYIGKSWKDLYDRIKELEAENARLRQQRDAANAQLDFIMENLKCDTLPEQNAS
ncbi:hypothetical protein [Salmonella phage S119]|nr:hypothetical protein [Salmonella phage S119]